MIEKLVAYLRECDDAYYNSDKVLINNDTYDAMVETLRRLDPGNPYLKKVGATVKSDKVGRLIPMGTLSKYHKDEEITKWLDSEKGIILLAPKYDGFAIELVYHRGSLISASTRGDGHVGEDVLAAVMRIKSVPIQISKRDSEYVTVRGEAIIPTKYHDEVKKLGYTAMRNAVPGIVRSNRKDALMYVDFVAYEFIDGRMNREEQREYYRGDFIIEDYRSLDYRDIKTMQSIRENLRNGEYEYELDGVVLKTNKVKDDDLMNPSHMIAWKYKSNRETTVLRDIEFNVGATGAISVIGIFDPVEFQGATLKRASFGSLALYEEMKPAIGDIIEVSRRGDIIPWIEEVVLKNSGEYIELQNCPCCGTPLEDGACKNRECSDRVKLKLYQYIKGVGVKGLGYALLVALVDEGIVKSLVDIYKMNAESILTLPRQGKSAVARWEELQNKELSALEFMCAYPIENSGKSLWQSLLSRYSLREIINLSEEELSEANIKGVGSSKIKSITSQLREYKDEISTLLDILNL